MRTIAIAFTLTTTACTLPALAAITAVGGAAVQIGPPTSVNLDALESNTSAFAFPEQQGVVLPAPLAVDVTAVGLVSSAGDLTPGTIPVGARVSSYLIHSDPVASGTAVYEGFVEFDETIIGLIVLRSTLGTSDPIGNPLTIYADYTARGMELGNDQVRLVIGRTRVDFRFNTSGATDDIRVITLVPAPASAALLGLGGLITVRRRR